MLNIIEREKSKCNPIRKPTAAKHGSKGAYRCRKLEGPYIKVEDMSGEYRPTSKNFASFPVIDLFNPDIGHDQSPFVARRKKVQQPDVPKAKGLSTTTEPRKDTKAGVVKHDVPNAVRTPNAAANPKDGTKSKVQGGYCESCDKQYQSLREHMKSDSHKKFALDSKNFLELDSVVSILPSLEQLIKTLQVSDDTIGVREEQMKSVIPEQIQGETPMDLCDGALSEADKGLITPIKVEKSSLSDETGAPFLNGLCDNPDQPTTCEVGVPLAIGLPPPTKVSQVASNVSSNDATLPYAGPGPETSQSEKELTLPYEQPGNESSQDEKDVTLHYETSQSEKDRTLPYEDQCPASSQEDLVYNQQNISVTVNDNVAVISPIAKHVEMSDRDVNLTENNRTLPYEDSQPSLCDVKPDIDALQQTLTSICPSEKTVIPDSESGQILREQNVENPLINVQLASIGSQSQAGQPCAQNRLESFEDLTENENCHCSSASGPELSKEFCTDLKERQWEAHSFDRLEREVKKEVTSTETVGAVGFVENMKIITPDELECMQHIGTPLPSESNEATLQEPLSSHGDHFNISPVKLLNQFPFSCVAIRSEESQDTFATVYSEHVPPSVKSDEEQSRASLTGFRLISESSNQQLLTSVNSNIRASAPSVPHVQTPSSQTSFATVQSVMVEGANGGLSEACLPESTTSNMSSYPTSFSNILSNLSAGGLTFNKDIYSANMQQGFIQGSVFSNIAEASNVEVENSVPLVTQTHDHEVTHMECSSPPSSDAVENSIAKNLMAKLQNQDLDSSGSESESAGFFKGNNVPTSLDLDSMDLVTNKITDIDSMITGESVVCDSQSLPNIVFPLDVNTQMAAESNSSIIPQTFGGQISPPVVEETTAVPLNQAEAPRSEENWDLTSSPDSQDSHNSQSSKGSLEESQACNVFNLNHNFLQPSFADLAQKAQILPHFQGSFATGGLFADPKVNNAFNGIPSNETTLLFPNFTTATAEETSQRPWSPSMILNPPTQQLEQEKAETKKRAKTKESILLKRGPHISPAKPKLVVTKHKKDRSKPKKKSSKKEKENSPLELRDCYGPEVSAERPEVLKRKEKENKKSGKKSKRNGKENSPDDGNTSPAADTCLETITDKPKLKKHKKKSKEKKLDKPKKSRTKGSTHKSELCESPFSGAHSQAFQTPKTNSRLRSCTETPDQQHSVWVATPSRGLKLRLCRVVVTPLGRKASEDEMDQEEIDVLNIDDMPKEEKSKRAKSGKHEKARKLEKSHRRRKLEL